MRLCKACVQGYAVSEPSAYTDVGSRCPAHDVRSGYAVSDFYLTLGRDVLRTMRSGYALSLSSSHLTLGRDVLRTMYVQGMRYPSLVF